MRVLFWSETFKPYVGGVEVLAAKLLHELKGRGHDLVVVTKRDYDDLPDESDDGGIPVYRFPFYPALAGRDIDQLLHARQKVARLKRAFKPHLVHINCVGFSAVLHLQTATAHPAPMLVTLHQASEDRFIQPNTVLGSILRSADWVAACSSAVLNETRRQLPSIIPHSALIQNSLAMPAWPVEPLPFESPCLLFLGRTVRDKGLDVALTALTELVARRPDLQLVIAGDGLARADLERQTVELGLTKSVDFVGWVGPWDVPALINRCTLVVMPSRTEAFGLAALQAAQMARPVVATRVGGLPEIVVHGETGLLVEKEDSRALAEAITFLLDHPQTAVQMGEAARRRAQEVFNWERYVDAYDCLYQKLDSSVSRSVFHRHAQA
jgi:glycogen(starch) synthase